MTRRQPHRPLIDRLLDLLCVAIAAAVASLAAMAFQTVPGASNPIHEQVEP